MNILFISPYLPSETSGHAGAQLIYRNIISLAKNHQITLASFIDSGEEYMLEPLINFGIDVHTIYYPRNKKSFGEKLSTGIKNIVPMVTFIAGKEPLYFAKYKNNQMTDLISRLNNENVFDIVQIEYNVMHHYRNLFQEIPSIIVFHDVSTKMYERGQAFGQKSNERSFKLAQKVEAEIANKFDGVVTLTVEDKSYLQKLGCEKNIEVIPPQIKLATSEFSQKKSGSICFVGSFNREPNVLAVEILMNQIYPQLNSDICLTIAGKGLPKSLQSKINQLDRIQYLGFVEDIDSFLSSQLLMVAPIEIGAGLKMKIPHALSCGTAVLTTDVGAEGIEIHPSEGMVVSSIESMADKAGELMIDEINLSNLGAKGKKVVESLYSESVIISKLEAMYNSVKLA